jgi:hypothetical protein
MTLTISHRLVWLYRGGSSHDSLSHQMPFLIPSLMGTTALFKVVNLSRLLQASDLEALIRSRAKMLELRKDRASRLSHVAY